MKILLINPAPSGTLKATGVLFPPLGLLYVAAYAEKEGHQVVEVLKKNGLEIHAAYILGGQHETAGMIHETIRFAKRLNTNVAQFSILTPYPGTAIYEQVKDRIFRWRAPWSFFDMQHLVFKHDHLSFIRMEWLLLKAHLIYYTRSKKGIQDIWHHIKKHHLGARTLLRFLRDYFGG